MNADVIASKTGFAATIAVYAYVTNRMSELFMVVCAFFLIDYVTGVIRSMFEGTTNSKIGLKGIIKKFSYILMIFVAFLVDYAIICIAKEVGISIVSPRRLSFGSVVMIWLIGNDGISILENFNAMGLRVPKFLKKVFRKMRDKKNSKEDL